MASSVLAGLEPAAVFSWFARLCAIPHGSGNTRAISDFCADFARERALTYRQDAAGNVVIWMDASDGYAAHPEVILQGHLDMVCAKAPGCDLDFTRDGLRLAVEGDRIFARGTTLGGDDGIAVAMALAILDDDSLPHPPLEVVLTVDEEIGLLGAAALDASDLRGRRLLNLDSEEEGVLTVSCAGGATCITTLPCVSDAASGREFRLTLAGLTGGHSGAEIHRGRANAIQLLGETLRLLDAELPLRLCALQGGSKDNAIAQEAQARFVLPASGRDRLAALTAQQNDALRARFAETDPALRLTWEDCGGASAAWDRESTARAIRLLAETPQGVQAMSRDIPGLVETSLNPGILSSDGAAVTLAVSVRSSDPAGKAALVERLRALAEELDGSFARQGDYPAWAYRQDSPLRDLMVRVYEEQTGEKPQVLAIHAGLECGLLADKLPGLDAVSFGPNLYDIHTASESMSVASVARTWRYLLAVLAQL